MFIYNRVFYFVLWLVYNITYEDKRNAEEQKNKDSSKGQENEFKARLQGDGN